MKERVYATYWMETGEEPHRAAEIIAGEQSSGTFVVLPKETPELKERFGARIERLEIIDTSSTPSLPTPQQSSKFSRCSLTLSWPIENMGTCLPTLMATVAGNLFELRAVSGLRITDLQLPNSFASAYPGPQFGIEGTRKLAGVARGPLIGTIIKPSVGLSASETADQVSELVTGGIDFIKDDELQADGPACPFDERARLVMQVINRHADRSGKKVMYAFNLTGELDEMKRRHDLVHALGGTCVMLSLQSVGLTGFSAFRQHAQLPVHGHRNGWGYLQQGWSYIAWQKLWRLAGADHLHVNGLANKFQEADASVVASARACLTPLFADKPCTVMPVFSSGQTVRQAPATWQAMQSPDLLFLAGGGLFAHPGGIAAGVTSLKQAWAAAMAGVSLEAAAKTQRELREALDTFR